MRDYEVLFILPPQVEDEAQDAVIKRFSDVIMGGGGEVVNIDKWGKRRLAYEIKDLNEGIYVLMNYKAPKETSQELDRLMKISDDIVRHLIVLKGA